MPRLARFAWFVIAWNVFTILLGAVVRATDSGAGCGRSWPTCQGQLLPALDGAAAVEFTHRTASGVALALVAALVVAVWRSRPLGHPARRSAAWAGLAIVGEALIGAAIVLYEWVADDSSVARAVAVPLHLVNTLLLLAALTFTAWCLNAEVVTQFRWRGRSRWWLLVGAAAFFAIAASGAVTALADTLFPSIGGGLTGAEHFLTRLRVIHPILAAITVAAALAAIRNSESTVLAPRTRSVGQEPSGKKEWTARNLVVLTLIQVILGAATIVLGSPLWLRLSHLLVADAIWISYVWFSVQVLSSSPASSETDSTGARQRKPVHR
ncbi:MAG: COX15/CtaA family protein [Acidimicrobiia bacterium]